MHASSRISRPAEQGRINRVDGKNQADDRNVQGDALHQSRQETDKLKVLPAFYY
jgi:hypothetical protein